MSTVISFPLQSRICVALYLLLALVFFQSFVSLPAYAAVTLTCTNSTSTSISSGNGPFTIAKTHSGNFRPGDIGDIFTLTVTNASYTSPTPPAAPICGTPPFTPSPDIKVIDTLPAGLTATAISGTGWACVLGTLTCTRSDLVAIGASYPPITITVNVANNAPAVLTNTAALIENIFTYQVSTQQIMVGNVLIGTNQNLNLNNDTHTSDPAIDSVSTLPSQTTTVPTMNEWGFIVFALLAGLSSVYNLWRQKRAGR